MNYFYEYSTRFFPSMNLRVKSSPPPSGREPSIQLPCSNAVGSLVTGVKKKRGSSARDGLSSIFSRPLGGIHRMTYEGSPIALVVPLLPRWSPSYSSYRSAPLSVFRFGGLVPLPVKRLSTVASRTGSSIYATRSIAQSHRTRSEGTDPPPQP